MSDPPLPFKVGFEDVVDYMSHPDMSGDFPKDILRARLEAIGTQEALEKNAIAKHGFPFRYHSPLDEAILVLHYFLTKSQQYPGSYIHIHSTHVPTKEEENTLASWKSPKAGLYLDLHAVIENHNHGCGKSGRIKRLFVFRDHAQLAFLESTGIGVILEQESIGIETGFLLISENRDKVEEITGAGVMLVELFDDDINNCEWFLGIASDQSQYPYLNDLTCRWHKGRLFDNNGELTPEAKRAQIDIEKYLELFRFEDPEPEEKHVDRSYRFPNDPDRFRRLLHKNYIEAFSADEVSPDEFNLHLNYRAIPGNLEQLLLALEQINESSNIKAIDSSSVKNTLKVHEADPNYRHWIRTTVQRALKNPKSVSLERIYILRAIRSEYEILKQEIDLYRDLISNRISRLEPHQDAVGTADSSNQIDDPVNIHLYAITMKAIDETFRKTPQAIRTELRKLLNQVFVVRENGKVRSILKKLDFLYSERLVFNYKDYKGEPGRAFYDADLFISDEYATKQARESRKVKCLSANDFAERQSKYRDLFEILRSRSIQLFPNPGENFSRLTDFERKLNAKGIRALTIDEVLDVSEVIQSQTEGVVTTTTRPTIFVSYARDDKERVTPICEDLAAQGYEVWEYEDGIPVGQHPIAKQDEAIRECTFFLCCWSKAYSGKEGGQIPREIDQALKRVDEEFSSEDQIFFLLAQLDDTEVRSDLAERFKYITLFKNNSWQQKEWRKLLAAITTGLKQRSGQ